MCKIKNLVGIPFDEILYKDLRDEKITSEEFEAIYYERKNIIKSMACAEKKRYWVKRFRELNTWLRQSDYGNIMEEIKIQHNDYIECKILTDKMKKYDKLKDV